MMFSINGIVYLTWLFDACTISINSYYLLKNDRKIPESKEFSNFRRISAMLQDGKIASKFTQPSLQKIWVFFVFFYRSDPEFEFSREN